MDPICNDKKLKVPSGWGTRHTLSIMGFFGFVLAYSMRFNMSLAIVQMVNQPKVLINNLISKAGNSSSLISSEHEVCAHHLKILENFNRSGEIFPTSSAVLSKRFTIDQSNDTGVFISDKNKFHWTEEEQGLILGSFFWGYIVTQYPGGKLAHIYGAKWIFSIGLLATGIFTMVLPWVTITWGKPGLLCIRVLQGLSEGVTFPSMHCMIAHWAPLEERSRMTNMIFSGIPLGTAITMIIGGYLLGAFGWPSLFYTAGICTFIWFIFWCFLVYDHPSEHPRIGADELNYIQTGLSGQLVKEHIPTPWKKVLTSGPILAIVIIHIGHTWGHYLLHSEVPKYLHAVHNFQIEHNGWFSALPQILNFAVCIIMSHFSDFLIVKNITSVNFTRKMCATVAVWGSAAAFIGMILSGCNTVVAVICLNVAGAVLGSSFSAWIVQIIDLAPNHAGSIMGVSNSISNCLGFVAPYVTGIILHANPSLTGWKIVFAIPAAINIIVNIIYLIFAKSDEMPWNRPQKTVPTI